MSEIHSCICEQKQPLLVLVEDRWCRKAGKGQKATVNPVSIGLENYE